ncbi:unnamed protein product [Oikopleura dioica]|uniref:Uncharacterized protein n=1 Tax=Oikopleura dioica TaxID=34765 RepID=E4WV92_OIKDI|nr:unnamed protein product [Oikopleura dioica]
MSADDYIPVEMDQSKPLDASDSFGDTTVLQFGVMLLVFCFCTLLGWMHYATKFQKNILAGYDFNQKWRFAQVLLAFIFVFGMLIIGIFANTTRSGTLKSCFEYVFAASLDCILVCLFAFFKRFCFMLAAKKDSPIRLLPIARYVTLKESTLPDSEIPEDEKSCISRSEAEESAEKSTTYLAFICAILIIVGIILEATVNAEITSPQ